MTTSIMDLFGRKRESQPLQLYGKLPLAKDYLRVGCGEGSGRDLREWLDRSFGDARDADDQVVLEEPLRFLGQGHKDPLVGCLWPSNDAGGLRRFPFTIFVSRRRKNLAQDLEAGLAEAEGVWRELAETRERCLALADGRQVLEEQRGRDIEIGSETSVESAPADFDTWVEVLWPEGGVEGLNELFGEVAGLARGGYGGPYRMPLVRDLPLRDQVVAWVDLLRKLGALPEDEVPTLFFPPRSLVPSREPATLVIAARPLAERDVAWLASDGSETGLGSADFARGYDDSSPDLASPPDARSSLRESLKRALASFGAPGA